MAFADKTIAFNVTGAPAHFTSRADKTWYTPSSNTLSAVNPGIGGDFSSICIAWNGAVVDPTTGELILPANGGHGDYAGNENYGIKLKSASPAWVRLNNPSTPSGGSDATWGPGTYGDGNPRATHGWGRKQWAVGRVWHPGLDAMFASGFDTLQTFSWDRTDLQYRNHGAGIANPAAINSFGWQGGPAFYDPVDDLIWSFAGFSNGLNCFTFSPSLAKSGTFTPTARQLLWPGRNLGGKWSVCCPDLRIAIVADEANSQIGVLDLTNPNAGWTFKSYTGTGALVQDGAGAVYHAPSRSVLCWHNSGANISKLKIPANPLTGSYVWSVVSPAASNSVVPPTSGFVGGAAVRTKFNIISDMGNGQAALCMVLSTSTPVYVYKLPNGELS